MLLSEDLRIIMLPEPASTGSLKVSTIFVPGATLTALSSGFALNSVGGVVFAAGGICSVLAFQPIASNAVTSASEMGNTTPGLLKALKASIVLPLQSPESPPE